MKVDLPKFVLEIVEKFVEGGYEIYIVGGAVRDILTSKEVYDWDFTTNATPEEMLKIFPEAFYDNKFGTVGISDESSPNPYEITTFRTESGYSDSRRPDKVEWGKSLKEDLSRRDFTINAMALKLVNSAKRIEKKIATMHYGLPNSDLAKLRLCTMDLIDPFDGQKDLKDRLIKAVGDPDERFSEDALRMMRAIRIATQLNFKVEEKTLEAINKNANLINKIARERVKEELFKILASPNPYEGILLFRQSGLLAVVLPELEKTFGVEQKSPQRHHKYDVGTHLLYALKECKSEDPVVRFATLLHDIGKPQTYKKLESGVVTFYNHEMVGTKIVSNIADRLKLSKKEKEKLVTLVRWHQFSVTEMQTDAAVRRFIKNIGKENIDDMLTLRTADRLGSGAAETSWRTEDFKRRIEEVQKEPFSVKDLKIDGNDVMKELNLKPGPQIGEILGKLFNEVVEKKVENKKIELLQKIKDLN